MQKSGFVSIIGRPNSGKSTLLNTVLKAQLSIVTPKAQTTRNRITGILTEKRGQIVFMDTPGIHQAQPGGMNEFMVSEARAALDAPHVIWYLVDPLSSLKHENKVLEILAQAPRTPILLIINKIDTFKKNSPSAESAENRLRELEESLRTAILEKNLPLKNILRISGLYQLHVRELLEETWDSLPEGPKFYPNDDEISDRPVRFFVEEKIREQLFHCLGDEVPYSCAVSIDEFNEKSQPIRIEGTIYVERESQKGIVIGQGGKKIKEIGQSARKQIEAFLGEKIFLGLKVGLLRNWSSNPLELQRLGYGLPKKGKSK